MLARVATMSAFSLVLLLPAAAAARPGDPDPSFGTNGAVGLPLGQVDDVRMAQDGAGRTLVAATRILNDQETLEVMVARVEAKGVIDDSFGDGGLARIGVAPDERIAGLVVTRDGRAFVAVTSHVVEGTLDPPRGVLTIVQLQADGRRDLDFGALQLPASDVGTDASDLLVHEDGRIDVATWYCDRQRHCSLLVFLHDADGGPRDSFQVPNDLPNVFDVRPLLQPDGRAIAAARAPDATTSTGYSLLLTRYETDGRRDPAFGVDGRLRTGVPVDRDFAPTVTLAPDGGLVVSGFEAGATIVARFDAEGHAVRDFGIDGRVSITLPNQPETVATELVLASDGHILIAGGAGVFRHVSPWFFAALRADGSREVDFGVDGIVVSDPGAFGGTAFRLLLQSDGRIVAYIDGVGLVRRLGLPRACADADGDGSITVTDGVQVLRAASGLPSSCLVDFCDTDANGAVTVTDGVATLRAAAALPTELRCVQ
jgi:uncharacterized delta-60 repeat protein